MSELPPLVTDPAMRLLAGHGSLSAAQFHMHGTTADVGSELVPPGSPEKSNWQEMYEQKGEGWRAHHVFTAPPGEGVEEKAWRWAGIPANRAIHDTGVQARPRVYHVTPTGGRGDEVPWEAIGPEQEVSRGATVHHVEWTPPRIYAQASPSANWQATRHGTQGTLPPLDWRSTYPSAADTPEASRYKERPFSTPEPGQLGEKLPPQRTRIPGQQRLLRAPSQLSQDDRLSHQFARTVDMRKQIRWGQEDEFRTRIRQAHFWGRKHWDGP